MGVGELLEEGEICETKAGFFDEQSIDDRIDRVLGKFRKGFEGLVSAEKLGPMFGGYGTFLIDPEQQQSSCSSVTWSGNPSGFQKQKPGICQVKRMGLEKSSCQVVSLNKLRQDSVGKKQESLYYMDKENIPSNVINSQVRKVAKILGSRSPNIRKKEAKENGRSSGVGNIGRKETNVVEEHHTCSRKRSCYDRLEDSINNLMGEKNKRQTLSNKTVHIKDSTVSVRNTTSGGCSKKVTILRVAEETIRQVPTSTSLLSSLVKEAKVARTLKDTSRHESRIGQVKDSATVSVPKTTSKKVPEQTFRLVPASTSSPVSTLLKEAKVAKTLEDTSRHESRFGQVKDSATVSVPKTTSKKVPEQTFRPVPASTSSPVSTLLKEVEAVKNCANSLKDTSRNESTMLFLEAAMKFLSGGSLIEQGNRETTGYDKSNAMKMYHSAAALSQYCAHEFEGCGNMALAALAYKCVEVTFMRIIYSAHGENHSSPASCVDNNLGHASNDFPKYAKLVELAKDVNCAMEASRKSRQAFAAAAAGNVPVSGKAVELIKSAINFSFHDVGEFIRRVHQAIEEL